MKKALLYALFGVMLVLALPNSAAAAEPLPQCSMSATPSTIIKGESYTLRWSSIHATAGRIALSSLGAVSPNGQRNLIPVRSTRIVGTFTGPGGRVVCETVILVLLPDGSQTTVVEEPDTFDAPAPITDNASLDNPPTAQAGPGTQLSQTKYTGLVPCGGPNDPQGPTNCQACHLVQLSQNIINFLLGLSIPLAAAMFAYAGIVLFTSSVGGKIEKARKIFFTVFVGFCIVLGAWVIVQTLMSTILRTEYQDWKTINCYTDPLKRPRTKTIEELLGSISVLNNPTTTQPPGTTPPPPPTGGNCVNLEDCSPINPDNFNIKNGGYVDPVYEEALEGFAEKIDNIDPNLDITVTEACPTTSSHAASCHASCTCTDIALADRNYTVNNINNVINAAQQAGMCAVYEVPGGQTCPPGVPSNRCLVVPHATGQHFSLNQYPGQSNSCR